MWSFLFWVSLSATTVLFLFMGIEEVWRLFRASAVRRVTAGAPGPFTVYVAPIQDRERSIRLDEAA